MKTYSVCIVGGGSTYTLGFLKSFVRLREEFPLKKPKEKWKQWKMPLTNCLNVLNKYMISIYTTVDYSAVVFFMHIMTDFAL